MPASARRVFAARTELAAAYAALLTTEGVTRGLIGPREAPRVWDRHLLNCAVLSEVVPEGADVCDIGSGAGLPGLVLAIRRPDLTVTLVEPLLRRSTFLVEAVDRLGLDQVTVLRSRAEDLPGRLEFSVVTSRAVAPLPRLLAWSMPLVRKGGWLLAMKGSSAQEEVREATAALRRFGAGPVEVMALGRDLINPPATVIRAEGTRPSRLRYEAARGDRSRSGPTGGRSKDKDHARDARGRRPHASDQSG